MELFFVFTVTGWDNLILCCLLQSCLLQRCCNKIMTGRKGLCKIVAEDTRLEL